MERTTIRLEKDLLKLAQTEAAAANRTFTQYVAEALREKIYRRKDAPKIEPYRVHTCEGARVRPGIDLTNNAELFELMDEEDAAR